MFDRGSLRRSGLGALVVFAAMLLLATGAQAASYNPATQSHRGACSQNTLNVSHAVADLNANHVLAQYASLIGVGARNGKLARAMRRALIVGRVQRTVTTANHGCTTTGVIFSVGPRTLHAGETVGVRLPPKYVGHACRGSHRGCKRLVVTRSVVLPTNCWNVNFGRVSVVIWVRPPRPPKTTPVIVVPKVPMPTVSANLTCNPPMTGGGTLTMVLSNGAKATLGADFKITVSGNSTSGFGPTGFGPLAPGKSLTETIPVDTSGNNVVVTVVSGGKTLLSSTYPGGCPLVQAE